jgi:hypothetical protein
MAFDNAPKGFNGGGQGAVHSDQSLMSGSGGGASDVRIGGNTPYHRVIVAGGGGGAGASSSTVSTFEKDLGGAGGGTDGKPGETKSSGSRFGSGGGQTKGGYAGSYPVSAYPEGAGKFGEGGYQSRSLYEGGGGGGGWYGGGAGCDAGGGGGSGWTYTSEAYAAWLAGNSADANNYSVDAKYSMENTATTISGSSSMPDPRDAAFDPENPAAAGQTMTGNARGGFVRVVYLGA